MTKVIKLESMIGGLTVIGETEEGKLEYGPCKTIQDQLATILEENQDYTFIDLVYHPSKTMNMEYASLMVDVKQS